MRHVCDPRALFIAAVWLFQPGPSARAATPMPVMVQPVSIAIPVAMKVKTATPRARGSALPRTIARGSGGRGFRAAVTGMSIGDCATADHRRSPNHRGRSC